jgi:hypothetical protein
MEHCKGLLEALVFENAYVTSVNEFSPSRYCDSVGSLTELSCENAFWFFWIQQILKE